MDTCDWQLFFVKIAFKCQENMNVRFFKRKNSTFQQTYKITSNFFPFPTNFLIRISQPSISTIVGWSRMQIAQSMFSFFLNFHLTIVSCKTISHFNDTKLIAFIIWTVVFFRSQKDSWKPLYCRAENEFNVFLLSSQSQHMWVRSEDSAAAH